MTTSEATSEKRSNTPIADRVGTIVLLVVHAVMAAGTAFTLLFAPMVTDACAYYECGSENWVRVAMGLGVWGSLALIVADVVVSTMRLTRDKLAWMVPLLFCATQLGLFFAGHAIASLAGPVNS